MGIVLTTEITIRRIGVNTYNKLCIWTCEFDRPLKLKRGNSNYNYIYDNIKTGQVYNIKHKNDELLDIKPVHTMIKTGIVKNICSLHLEFSWLKDYKEIVFKNSKKRFIIPTSEVDHLQIDSCYTFEYQKRYDNLYIITKL